MRNFLLKIKCKLFGHNYAIKRVVTSYIREVECKYCKKEFAMCDALLSVVTLDDDLETLHSRIIDYNDTIHK